MLDDMARSLLLTPRERQIIVLQIACAKENNRIPTLEALGHEMGISKVRAKQIRDNAFKKLRENYRY